MEEKLVIHPAIHDPCNGDIIIELTDFQLHTNARATQSVSKTIEHSIEANQPGRITFPNSNVRVLENNTVIFSMPIFNPDEMLPLIQRYREQGKRVFIRKPKELPVFTGKDTNEFMDSKKGKRILRRLEKQEQVDKI
jgi:hypothetical protein